MTEQYDSARMATCSHIDQVQMFEPAGPVAGCKECLETGGWWVHLRMCQICGHIGCCDDSPSKHATAHFHASAHPIIRSVEPGEDWSWCYVDEVMFILTSD